MTSYLDLPIGDGTPELITAVIEIPQGGINKYEYDKTLGIFRLDRALYSPMHYPGDYGFIPGTLAEDHDPLDVLTLTQEASFTGCLIEVRPVGVLNMWDQNELDLKILAVPNRNPRYDEIHTMDQIFPHIRREMEHFFSIYKELEGKITEMRGWGGPKEARKAIVDARQSYLNGKKQEAAAQSAAAGKPKAN